MKYQTIKQKVKVIVPQVQKYQLTYLKSNGRISDYIISPPIDKTDFNMTVYAYGVGIRTFKFSNILDMK